MNPTAHLLWINHFAVAPSEGGGTRHFELARELTCLGWRVSIAASDFHLHHRTYTRRVTTSHRDPVTEQLDGVDFVWLWSAPYRSNDWRRVRNWLSFSSSVRRFSRRTDLAPDVVIGSSPHLFGALAGLRLAQRLGVPFVLEVRDLWPESIIAAGGRKGVTYFCLQRLARYLYRHSDRIIVLARGSARHIENLGIDPGTIVYVPNGVDVGAFASVPRPSRMDDRFTLVYAGAHGPANGLDVVLDAAELLVSTRRIRFLLVGDGPAKPALVQSALSRGLGNVEFRESVPKSSVPSLLAGANAGLMVLRDSPLFSYGVSPNKLFDYMGASLPIVCNVPGDVAGMLAEAGAGEQAADGSARALADAVLRLQSRSPTEREAMGRAGREWVSREHARSVLAVRIDTILRDLVVA